MAEKTGTFQDSPKDKKIWEQESCESQILEAIKMTKQKCTLSPYPSRFSSSFDKDVTMQDLTTKKDEKLQFENDGNSKTGDDESDIKKEKVLKKSDNMDVSQSSRSDAIEDDGVFGDYSLYRLFVGPSFLKSQYAVSTDPEKRFTEVLDNCKALFEKDYFCYLIKNGGGELSDNCPIDLIVPVASKYADKNCEGLLKSKVLKYERLMKSAKSQLIVPVILFENKFICRSDPAFVKEEVPSKLSPTESSVPGEIAKLETSGRVASKSTLVEEAARLDKTILNSLDVDWICDLMEQDGEAIIKSDDTNRDVHRSFKMNYMPYPGCGFFKSYHDKKWDYVGLLYEWGKEGIIPILRLDDNSHADSLNIDVGKFKNWDIVELTQNYMKILLSYIAKGTSGGLLVHCISGRDRTPLIISLLRISLWADGVIHKSLRATEMAYLTLAYDWLFFGHDLQTRFDRKEEIMHFCFNFLPSIDSEEYSVTKMFQDMKPELKGDRSFPEFDAGRRAKLLKDLRWWVLRYYTRWHVTIEWVEEKR